MGRGKAWYLLAADFFRRGLFGTAACGAATTTASAARGPRTSAGRAAARC